MTTDVQVYVNDGSHKTRITVQDRQHGVEKGPEKWGEAERHEINWFDFRFFHPVEEEKWGETERHEINPGEGRRLTITSTRRIVIEELDAAAESVEAIPEASAPAEAKAE